jgi:hypothetical protein
MGARLAQETTDEKVTAAAWKKLAGWITFLWKWITFLWKELPAFVLSLLSLLGLAYVCWLLLSVRKHLESFESFVIQEG